MFALFLREWRELPSRMGGSQGAFRLAALLLLATLPALRLGSSFLDPVFLLAYAGLAPLFAGPFAILSFAAELLNPVRVPVRSVAFAKVLAAASYGLLSAALLLAVALAALVSQSSRLPAFPVPTLCAFLILAVALSTFSAALSAWIFLGVDSAATAARLLRLAFLFLVLVTVVLYPRLPAPARSVLAAALVPGVIIPNALLALLALSLLSLALTFSAAQRLRERRTPLTLFGENRNDWP